jgi:hypothetical protein
VFFPLDPCQPTSRSKDLAVHPWPLWEHRPWTGRYQRLNIYPDVYIRLIHHQDGENEPRFRCEPMSKQHGTWLTLYWLYNGFSVDFHIEDEKHVPDDLHHSVFRSLDPIPRFVTWLLHIFHLVAHKTRQSKAGKPLEISRGLVRRTSASRGALPGAQAVRQAAISPFTLERGTNAAWSSNSQGLLVDLIISETEARELVTPLRCL